MIPQSFIQELLNRLDIVDVVDRYVPLKKAGANYQACCPFHSEKTPSFTVSPTKQFYHCFGCGAHGTAISFLMEQQGLGFVEAVEELARGVGLTVPREEGPGKAAPATDKLNELSGVLERAARFYREQLKQSDAAIAYLKSRGLSGEIAARFGIGYAPAGWQGLSVVVPGYRTSSALLEAGLVIENDEGKRYDRFRDRIMFPILGQRGGVIGFGGRVMGAGEPKYLNSPETPLFEKGRELYGLVQARQAIRAAGMVIVVEGYMDVVALAQHGVGYAVATLGTATTPAHVQKLFRQSDTVVFCFDGDTAGRKAAWRALENALALLTDDKTVKFLFLPQGEDPDSFIRKQGKEAFEGLLKDALPLSQFILQGLAARVDMESLEGRAHFVKLAQPLVAQIGAPTLGRMVRRRVAELAGLQQSELGGALPVKSQTVRSAGPARAPRRAPSLARRLLQLLVFQPELGAGFDGQVRETEPEARALAAVLEFIRCSPQLGTTASVVQHFVGTPYEALIREVSGEILSWEDGFEAEAEFAGACDQWRKRHRQQEVEVLLAKARAEGLNADEKQLLQQLLQR
jgi:DNA primase